MSRVPADTVFLRLAVVAAIALPLSGCGGDDPETASTPVAPAATTPVAPTTGDVTAPGAADVPAPDAAKTTPEEPTREEAEAIVEETKKVAKEAGEKASPAKQSTASLTEQVKRSFDALKDAGMKVDKPIVDGDDSAALAVDNGMITIAFFRSPREAASAGATTDKAFKDSPQQMTVVRKANRLFILSSPTKLTDAQLEKYKKVRQVVNDAV